MRNISLRYNRKISPLVGVLGSVIVLAALSADRANGQTVVKDTLETKPSVSATVAAPAVQTTPAPLFTAYKSITIGLTADEVKQKLGKPKSTTRTASFTRSPTMSLLRSASTTKERLDSSPSLTPHKIKPRQRTLRCSAAPSPSRMRTVLFTTWSDIRARVTGSPTQGAAGTALLSL